MKTKTGLFVLKLIFFVFTELNSVFGPEVIGGLACISITLYIINITC